MSNETFSSNDPSAIAAHIEDNIRRCFNAVNSRDWDFLLGPESVTHISNSYTMIYPSQNRAPNTGSRVQFLEGVRRLSDEYPDWRLEITSMSTHIYAGGLAAQTYVNAKSMGEPGIPLGMSKPSVTVFEYRKLKGLWLGVSETTFYGAGDELPSVDGDGVQATR